MCVCYSGQCLMSSLIGGRSGNRDVALSRPSAL
ncbi:MAG: U32 family peptidase [Phascolarctobacterium faecium]